MEKEIIWDTRGSRANTRQSKDSTIYTFKNGSTLQNVAASENTRGARFHSGLMEECVSIDQKILNEVIIPTMNVSRLINGKVDEHEKLNKSQCFITTAGYKNTFAYDKLIQILCQSVARPETAIVLGGSWRVPVIEGLLDRDFITQLKLDGTYDEASFDREYESIWTGDVESAFFSSDVFDKRRVLQLPEYKANGRTNSKGYYVLGVDVGRLGCTTEVVVIKVTPTPTGVPRKQIVNLFSYEAEHFALQSIHIKRIFNQFNCRAAVIDGNGLGHGLVDMLTTDQEDPDTGETLWNWGVINDDNGDFRKMRTTETITDAMYIMKANASLNTEMYSYCQAQMRNGKVLFLVDGNIAKGKLLDQAQGKKMSPAKRIEYLKPYYQTNFLKDQMLNLIEVTEGVNITLKPNNKKIKHDKFSALIYGLYYCKLQEDKRGKKRMNVNNLMCFSKGER